MEIKPHAVQGLDIFSVRKAVNVNPNMLILKAFGTGKPIFFFKGKSKSRFSLILRWSCFLKLFFLDNINEATGPVQMILLCSLMLFFPFSSCPKLNKHLNNDISFPEWNVNKIYKKCKTFQSLCYLSFWWCNLFSLLTKHV